jgi:positive regulator of sigma E activity
MTDFLHKYYRWILDITLILNIFVCLIYNYLSEPSVVGMGLMFYLLPLLCVQILITIVGYIFKSNQIVNRFSVVLGILILAISVYYAQDIE